MKNQKLLNQKDQLTLRDALYYMKMEQLKRACSLLALPHNGNKIALISRIITFVQSGTLVESPVIPKQSRASNYPTQPLKPDALMLSGGYKNDAKTRAFFKNLIGAYFHFTAFGIDWLNDRWLKGNPPTYQEFAQYWIQETKQRAHSKPKPKDEWQYINFLQQMSKELPSLSKDELMNRWKTIQAEKAALAFKLLESIIKKL